MKYKGSYQRAVQRLDIKPAPAPLPPPPETREAALIRLGELEQKIVRGQRGSNVIAEKMQIQTLLSTTLKRGPTPKKSPPPMRQVNEEIPYVGPRCDFCGGEAPGGICINKTEGWPHP